MCLVEDMMNTLDDCDLLEKVVNMTDVHEHNDVTVSINTRIQSYSSFFLYQHLIILNCGI